MRKVIGHDLNSLDGLRLIETDPPRPGPGEVLLRVRAVGLGYVDGLIATGKYQIKPALPFTPGGEIAGEVEALGPGVSGVSVGERVAAWMLDGGLADYCVVPEKTLRPIGATLDFAKAAAIALNYATALNALQNRGALQPGETLLVLGAAGGVGLAAIEVGRKLEARVIAAASSKEKRDFALATGAHDVVDYKDPEWRAALKSLTKDRGVDVVFDPVGGDVFEPAFRSLAWRGRHLVVGFAGGAVPSLRANLALLKGASLVGVDTRQFDEREPVNARANLAKLFEWADQGDIRVPLSRVYALEEFREAMIAATSGAALGKVVVAP